AGLEPGDPYVAPAPQGPFFEATRRPPRKLKIAVMLADHRGSKLDPECATAVGNATKLCASLGHVVEEATLPIDLVALRPMNATIAATNTARTLSLRWKTLRRAANPEDVEAVTWAVYNRGLKVSGVEYVEAMAAVHAAGRALAHFLKTFDVLLT